MNGPEMDCTFKFRTKRWAHVMLPHLAAARSLRLGNPERERACQLHPLLKNVWPIEMGCEAVRPKVVAVVVVPVALLGMNKP
jgi:hypothetical protein